jgi:hypothetical protein
MAKVITTEIQIHAKPEHVWSVFSDFKNYPNWNPFITSIQGNFSVGQTITVNLNPPDAKPMTFKPKLLICNENKKLVWIGHLFIKGLFDGEHSFEIVDHKDGTCTFIQSEKFNGILVPVLKKLLETNTLNGFKLMNQKLKERVESMNK